MGLQRNLWVNRIITLNHPQISLIGQDMQRHNGSFHVEIYQII